MSNTINSLYPLSALLIHATQQEVTKEKMQAIFKTLGLEFSPKIASFFTLSADKLSSIISNVGGSASAPAATTATGATSAKAEEAAPAKEESSSDDAAFDF